MSDKLTGKSLRKLWQKCERVDWMLWGLQQFGLLDEKTARTFAVACAEHTLHFFEELYPVDNRPRLAIEAARRCIEDQSHAAWSAADAAGSAAGSAARNAADAARNAARNAADAAWSAARNAARNAAEAAWSAAWSAADAAGKAENKWQADKLRELINPFGKGTK